MVTSEALEAWKGRVLSGTVTEPLPSEFPLPEPLPSELPVPKLPTLTLEELRGQGPESTLSPSLPPEFHVLSAAAKLRAHDQSQRWLRFNSAFDDVQRDFHNAPHFPPILEQVVKLPSLA
jgi:hypothetical protein